MSKSKIDLFCREVTLLSIVDHPNILKFVVSAVPLFLSFLNQSRGLAWKSRASLLLLLVWKLVNSSNDTLDCLIEYIEGGSLYMVIHVQRRVRMTVMTVNQAVLIAC